MFFLLSIKPKEAWSHSEGWSSLSAVSSLSQTLAPPLHASVHFSAKRSVVPLTPTSHHLRWLNTLFSVSLVVSFQNKCYDFAVWCNTGQPRPASVLQQRGSGSALTSGNTRVKTYQANPRHTEQSFPSLCDKTHKQVKALLG